MVESSVSTPFPVAGSDLRPPGRMIVNSSPDSRYAPALLILDKHVCLQSERGLLCITAMPFVILHVQAGL